METASSSRLKDARRETAKARAVPREVRAVLRTAREDRKEEETEDSAERITEADSAREEEETTAMRYSHLS